jgi:hypothetical protein
MGRRYHSTHVVIRFISINKSDLEIPASSHIRMDLRIEPNGSDIFSLTAECYIYNDP